MEGWKEEVIDGGREEVEEAGEFTQRERLYSGEEAAKRNEPARPHLNLATLGPSTLGFAATHRDLFKFRDVVLSIVC